MQNGDEIDVVVEQVGGRALPETTLLCSRACLPTVGDASDS